MSDQGEAEQTALLWRVTGVSGKASLCRETGAEWDKEIAEDVKEECGKFGAVSHVYVDRNSKVFHF